MGLQILQLIFLENYRKTKAQLDAGGYSLAEDIFS